MRKPRISVLVVENHSLMREALCTAIADESDFSVAGLTVDGVTTLSRADASRPDIILLSLADPEPGFLAPLANLRRAFPVVPILALTATCMPEQDRAVLASGAQRVLNRAASRQELLQALRSVRPL